LNLGGSHSALFNQDDPIPQGTESGVHEMREIFGLDARVF
jgi:hypothetical protein